MDLSTLKKLERAAWRMKGAFDEAARNDSNAAYVEVADLWQRYYTALRQRELELFDSDAARCTIWTVYRPASNGAVHEIVRTPTRHCSGIRWNGAQPQHRHAEHRGSRDIEGDFRRAMDHKQAA